MENTEKAKLIKEALEVVDKLGQLDSDYDQNYYYLTEELIEKAKKIRKNKYWVLD